MAEYTLSEQQVKLILEQHLTIQLKIILDETTVIDNGCSWDIVFQGLPAESFTISKKGELL